MNQLKHILQSRYLFKIIAIFVLLGVIIYTNNYKFISKYDLLDNEFIGIVYKIKKSSDKTTLYIKGSEKLIINYYKDMDNISLGDTITVNGELVVPSNNTIPYLFNYKKYLQYDKINYIVKAKKIEKIKNNTNIIYAIRNIFQNRILSIPRSSTYINTFILGNTDLMDDSIKESYRMSGISHLFSISGMHVSLFASFLLYFLKRISYNRYYNYGVVIIFLILYMLLVGIYPSILRSVLMYILFSLNKLFNMKVNRIDTMLIVLIIILIINPFWIYSISMQYSYIISFSLILFSNKIKRVKNKVLSSLYVSFIAFIVSIPISISNFNYINVFSILLNLLVIPMVSVIIFPLSLISFIFPYFSYVLNIFVSILEFISSSVSKYHIGIIHFPYINIYLIVIYYIFIYLFLYNRKLIFIFIIMIIHKYNIYFRSYLLLTILDVGNGDSILISLPHNEGNILLDSGGINNYELVISNTIPYLHKLGIDRIDYFIASHGDYDHMGEAINLVNNFKVEKVIFNCGPYNDLEKELIKVLDKKHIKYYSCIKELNIDKNKLYFLQTKEYDNENDNSNVVYTELNGYKFMFMGDASITTEKEILNKYNLPDIDVLKVGHHGSRTSSGKEFINEINPKYSIISVGKNNRYGHPNKEVLDNLENFKIYRTDQDGSIMFKIKNNKINIETCAP